MSWLSSIKLESSDIRKRKLQKQVSQLNVVVYYGVFLVIAGFVLNISVLYQILSVIMTENLQQQPLLQVVFAIALSSIGMYMVKALPQFWNLNLYVNVLDSEYSGKEWPGSITGVVLAIVYVCLVGFLILDISQITPQQNLYNAFNKAVSGDGMISFLVAGIHHLILGSSIVLFFTTLILISYYLYPWQMGVRAWYRRSSSSVLSNIVNLEVNNKEICEQCHSDNFQIYEEKNGRVICNYCGLEKENVLVNSEEDCADSTTK